MGNMTNAEPERWDAEEWLRQFEDGKLRHDTQPARIEVFRSTCRIVKAGTYVSRNNKTVFLGGYMNPDSLADNEFYKDEIAPRTTGLRHETKYRVVAEDCLSLASRLHEEDRTADLCVLNLASASTPGGGVWGGAGAQEEYLFRCSDYYRFLFQYAVSFDSRLYGITPNPHQRYPLDSNFGGVYSRGVTVFRDTEAEGYALLDEPWQVNFIAVAAFNLRREERGARIPDRLVEPTKNKIRTILRIAAANGQTRLVLGALGCGAFGNPPKHMAQLFRETLHSAEFDGCFREVWFAILRDHNDRQGNYGAFAEVFGEK